MDGNIKAENERIASRLRVQRYRARQRGEDEPLRRPGPRPARPRAVIGASPGSDRGYALVFQAVVQHVVTELAKAGTRGASVAELAATYRHPNPSDLSRVKLWHGLEGNAAAERFLIDRAVSALGVRYEVPGIAQQGGQLREARGKGRYRLAVPADEVTFEGETVHRYEHDKSS